VEESARSGFVVDNENTNFLFHETITLLSSVSGCGSPGSGVSGSSIMNRAPWPGVADFAGLAAPDDAGSLQLAIDALAAIHKAKADAAVSAGREIERLARAGEPATLARLEPVLADVLSAARASAPRLEARPGLEPGSFLVADVAFAERAQEGSGA
jgi:hypothetical protein